MGVFHDLAAPGFPAKQVRLVLVTVIEWGRADEGRNKFCVDLTTPDGRKALTVDGHTEVARVPQDRPPPRTRLILPLEDVIFPVPGSYRFEIRVKGRRFRGPSLFLIAGDPGRELRTVAPARESSATAPARGSREGSRGPAGSPAP